MTAELTAALLAGCAGLLLAWGSPVPRRRLAARKSMGAGEQAGGTAAVRVPAPGRLRSAWARIASSAWAGRATGGLVASLVLAGRSDLAVPLAVAGAAVLLPARRRAVGLARRDARVARDLPRVADLMATCLHAGVAPADAVVIVSDAVGGPVRDALLPVASAVRLGVDPAAAWGELTVRQSAEPLRRLSRAFARAAASGAPLAETLSGVAEDERERLRWDAEAAARRAGVRVVGPLAVCFLPAFLLLGVVPVVVGIASEVTGRLG